MSESPYKAPSYTKGRRLLTLRLSLFSNLIIYYEDVSNNEPNAADALIYETPELV